MSCTRTFLRHICLDKTYQGESMDSLLDDPDTYLARHCKRYIKQGGVSDVAVIDVSGREMVLKRYNKRGMWHYLRNLPRTTRAMKSWRNAGLLLQLGIATAKPVAMIEHRLGPLSTRSYFVSEFVQGEPIHHYMLSASISMDRKTAVADKVTDIFDKLAGNRVGHGDMKATNIIIHEDIPMLMDLDAMKQFSSETRYHRALRKDIHRFMKNWANNAQLESIFKKNLQHFG